MVYHEGTKDTKDTKNICYKHASCTFVVFVSS
jgi:hypothetical protein